MSSVLQCMHPQSFNFRSQQYGALVVSELHEESQCLYYCQSVQSSFQNISSAGPQGSVLAHLLFIIFYRDVPRIVSFPCAVFADDTPLFDRCSGTSDAEHENLCPARPPYTCRTSVKAHLWDKCKNVSLTIAHFASWPAMRVINLGIRTLPVLSVAKKLAAPRPTPTAPAAKCGLIRQDEADKGVFCTAKKNFFLAVHNTPLAD